MALLDAAARRFNERAARKPSTFQLAILALLTICIPVWLGSERGIGVGVLAALVWGPLYFIAGWRHAETIAWSQRHPYLDLLWLLPLAFLAFAGLTDWRLTVCAAAAVAVTVVTGGLKAILARRRARPVDGGARRR